MTEYIMTTDDGGGRVKHVPVDYPANSRKLRAAEEPEDRPPPKKVEKIVEGKVVTRKRNVFRRVGEAMTGEETGEGVLYYVLMDVFVPAAKSMILDIGSQGLERILYGENRPRSRSDRPSGYVSYNRMARPSPQFGTVTPRARVRHEFDEVILPTRGAAEDVLDGLRELINVYDVATVADFYDLVGETRANFPDEEWGWYDLRSAMVRHTRGGYLITLPKAVPLDR